MRTHADVIRDAGGAQKVRELLGLPPKQFETVKSWFIRNSIPGEYWWRLSLAGLAELDELAVAAEARFSTRRRAA